PEDLLAAREAWKRDHHLALPDLLDPDLFATVARALDDAPFIKRSHGGVGAELCALGGRAFVLLEFLTNDPRLFAMVRDITGAPPFGCFEGRIYRQIPGGAHHDSWHDDNSRTRTIALSINLGAEPYEGGLLQIRDRA